MTTRTDVQAEAPFSLMGGGPLFGWFERIHLGGRRARPHVAYAFSLLVGWLPLLLFSAIEGHALGGVRIPFLFDFAEHVRFLLALPLLVLGVRTIDPRIARVVRDFVDNGLVAPEDLPRYRQAIAEEVRSREAPLQDLLLAVLAWSTFLVGANDTAPLHTSSWRATVDAAGGTHRTLANAWFVLVSLPVYRFVVLRWMWRLLLWARVLWRISRIRLRLQPAHPDRIGGLGFVNLGQVWFLIVVFPLSATFTARVAEQLVYLGLPLKSVVAPLAAFVVLATLLFVAPLLVFSPQLLAARRQGQLDFGTFAERYVRDFAERWLRGMPTRESPIGSSDIQSLADLANSFDVVHTMRVLVPDRGLILPLAAAAFAPMVPLLLQQFSFTDLLLRVLRLSG